MAPCAGRKANAGSGLNGSTICLGRQISKKKGRLHEYAMYEGYRTGDRERSTQNRLRLKLRRSGREMLIEAAV